MKTLNKISIIFLLLAAFFMPTSAAMTLPPEAMVGTTLIVSGLPPGAEVQFILNGGVPVFAVADGNGTAKYLPLLGGNLEIIAMKDGTLIDRATVAVFNMVITEARVNTTLIVSGLPPGAEVQFILNGGVPVFVVADNNGTARYLPLLEGSLKIIARQNGVIIGSATVTVAQKLMIVSEARVNTTLIVSELPSGAEVQFILNGGVPVFAIADVAGTARYLPLLEGSLEIIARQNGVRIGRAIVTVLPEVIIPPEPITVVIKVRDNINPRAQGVVRVAILNDTPQGFDVATIDIATVRFGQAAVVKNVTEGNNDLLLHFNVQDTGIECGDTQVTLTGKTTSGQDIAGIADIVTVGCEAPPKEDKKEDKGGGRGGRGGGTGGGGVTTDEPHDNIEKSEKHEKALVADTPITYNFAIPEHGVEQIVVTGIENENNVALKIEFLKGTAKVVTEAPPGIVYKNLNILSGTKRIKKAVIKFKVENTWMQNNGLTAGDMKMLRWDGSKWVQLEIKETTKDGTYTRFEAITTNFSNFAIAGIKPVVALAPVAITETPAKPAKPQVAAVPTPKAEGFEFVLAIAALSALYVLWRKRR